MRRGDDEEQRGVIPGPGSCRGKRIHFKLPGVWAGGEPQEALGGSHNVRVFESPPPSPDLGMWAPSFRPGSAPAVESFVFSWLRSPDTEQIL